MDKERSKSMLKKYIYEKMTLQQIGDIYGLTRERVRQILNEEPLYQAYRELKKKRSEIDARIAGSIFEGNIHLFEKQLFFKTADIPAPDKCWNWTGAINPVSGYGQTNRSYFEKLNAGRYAHRVAWALQNGPIPEGYHILHVCDNPACVNPSHLFMGTAKDNHQDAIEKGRKNSNQLQHRKLQDFEIEYIRENYQETQDIQWLAELFNVTPQYIYRIAKFNERK